MIKDNYIKILLILTITIHPALIYGNNYLRIKYSGDTSDFSYRNSYISYGLHCSFNDKFTLNIGVKKLSDENGYYPAGYITSSEWGLYERGSYSVILKDVYGFDKIIFGNYMPHFGQGLLFGGGYPLYIYNPYYDLGRFRDDIVASKAYSKSSVLEGIATVYSYGMIKIRPFISWNSYDCSAGESDYYRYNDNDYDGIPNDEDEDNFTNKKNDFTDNYSCKYSLEKAINDETIYSNDEYRNRRNKLGEYVVGINSSLNIGNNLAGLTFIYTGFNRMIDPYYSFDPESGDKTAYYFRGKDYFAVETYFKHDGQVQIYGDIIGSYYKSLSYYNEFSGKYVSSIGISSGIRTKIEDVSLLAWVGYIPANIVNPHAVEYPWGRRNFASAVTSLSFSSDRANFNNWIELSKELFSIDNPGTGEEVDFSYNYSFFYSILDNLKLELRQKYRVIDNYYYFPDIRSYKITTKFNIKHRLAKHVRLTDVIEYRFGKAENSKVVRGLGMGSRVYINKNNWQIKGMIFGYITDDSILAYLYPYEPSMYRWSFLPSSLNGKGILFSTSFTRDITDFFTAGFKIRFDADVINPSKSSLNFYLDTEMRF